MSDLSRIVDEMCAWFDGIEPASVPTLPTSAKERGKTQVYDFADNSHTSHISHTEIEASRKSGNIAPKKSQISAERSRVASSHVGDVGNVGSVGNEVKTLAGSTSLPFPQDLENVGSVGTEGGLCGAPFSGRSRAVLPPGDSLPISAADVRAGVERELRLLAEDGREGPAALRDAVEITRAKIRNSEALAERQFNGSRCHVCNGSLFEGLAIAVLSWSRGGPLHLHAGCHDAYRARRAALVNDIMRSAGFGAETLGEAP